MISRQPCQVMPLEAQPQAQADLLVNCDFNNRSFCSWAIDKNVSVFDWQILGKGDTIPSQAPPNGALTSDGYIYVRRSLSTASN